MNENIIYILLFMIILQHMVLLMFIVRKEMQLNNIKTHTNDKIEKDEDVVEAPHEIPKKEEEYTGEDDFLASYLTQLNALMTDTEVPDDENN